MQAITFSQGGGAEVLQLNEVAQPEITQDNQLLIRLKAAGINPIDTKLRARPDAFPLSLPAIPGCDGAGVVEAVGSGVKNFQVGDEVYYCQPGFNGRQGNYAQYAVVDDAYVAHKPNNISFTEAAALPLVLITAWEALHDRVQTQTGDYVFIQAGAGGVGHIAIQLARLAGAKVATTVSSQTKADLVSKLGADYVVNYQQQDVIQEVMRWSGQQGADIGFDTLGGKSLEQTMECVKVYGDVVTILQPGADTNWSTARKRNQRLSLELMLTPTMLEIPEAQQHQGEILQQAAKLIERGELQVVVDKTFVLAAAAQAHTYLEQQHPMGKVVLLID